MGIVFIDLAVEAAICEDSNGKSSWGEPRFSVFTLFPFTYVYGGKNDEVVFSLWVGQSVDRFMQ